MHEAAGVKGRTRVLAWPQRAGAEPRREVPSPHPPPPETIGADCLVVDIDRSPCVTARSEAMPSKSYAASHFLLSLDGTLARIEKLAGGAIRGEVSIFRTGSESLAIKRISAIRYEPFRLAVGMGMGQPLYDWIKAALGATPVSKNGSVALANASDKADAYRHFRDALIEEITFPELDTSSKETALFTIKLSSEQITYAAGDGASLKATFNAKQKKWLCSNFRFRLAGLENACKRVTKIDSFTVKQSIVEIAAGGSGIRTKHPTTLEIPNLRVTFSAADAKPWQDWFDDFVIKSNTGSGKEKNGTIEFLDPSGKATLGTVNLVRCGIFSLDLESLGGTGNAGPRYAAELYVQGMQVDLKNV
jgi:hypothetical protein